MRYIDIHTHQQPVRAEDDAIINLIVGREEKGFDLLPAYRSCGIHPWYIDKVEEQVEQVEILARRAEFVAIGEVGLDKYVDTPMERQRQVFMAQVELAGRLDKPLVIHCVKAWAELIACKKSIATSVPWIIHGFRGNAELANQLIRLGFFLSFGVRFNPLALRAAWPDRIFLETDDQPVDIRLVYQEAASVIGQTEELFAAQIERNISILHLGR